MAQERKITSGLSSEYIIHPGVTLKEILEDRNINQNELAIYTGVSAKHISKIITGDADISISFAKKLEYVFDIEAQFWINLQSNYDREKYEYEELHSISSKELALLKEFKEVIVDYDRLGLLNKKDEDYLLVLKLRSILGISNLANISKINFHGAYKIGNNINKYVLFSWQKMCEIKNRDIEATNKLDLKKLKSNINKIKETMFLEPNKMIIELKKIFFECGIVFDVVRNYEGAPVQGYIKQIYGDKLLLCLTLRMNYVDIFWSTLLHEIAHILNKDYNHKYIDFRDIDNRFEKKADTFAKNSLISPKQYKEFISEGDFSLKAISTLAKKNRIEPTIVLGRLLYERKADVNELNKYRLKYEWCD